jgi:hypothetical protein
MAKVNGVKVTDRFPHRFLRNVAEVERIAESIRRDLEYRAATDHPNRAYRADLGDLEALQRNYASQGYDPQGYPQGWTGPREVGPDWKPRSYLERHQASCAAQPAAAPRRSSPPTAHRPTATGRRRRATLTQEAVEHLICESWLELAAKHGDWVRLARLRPLLSDKGGEGLPKETVDAVLVGMITRVLSTSDGFQATCVHLAPDSNRKALTADDHDAAIRIGTEDKHLLAIEDDYFAVTGWRRKKGRWVR